MNQLHVNDALEVVEDEYGDIYEMDAGDMTNILTTFLDALLDKVGVSPDTAVLQKLRNFL